MRDNLVQVPLIDLQGKAITWSWMYNLGQIAKSSHMTEGDYMKIASVPMDAHPKDGGHFIYWWYDNLPLIVLLDGKVYDTNKPTPKYQDASDLPLYDEIIELARWGRDKSKDTCDVICYIHRELTVPALTRVTDGDYTDDTKREIRGRILRAKFNAVTIWQEGKLRKEQS